MANEVNQELNAVSLSKENGTESMISDGQIHVQRLPRQKTDQPRQRMQVLF